MIIERFHAGKEKAMYRRFAEKGRMLPEGVSYINSWINESITVGYQLMESEFVEALQEWIDKWKDLVEFEVVQVISSEQAKEKVFKNE